MKAEAREELAKLHCVKHLFAEHTGGDHYLVQSIKEAIDESLESTGCSTLGEFTQAAQRLFEEQSSDENCSRGLFHLDLHETGYEPLFIREALMRGLKRIAGFQNSLVVVTGLHAVINPEGSAITRRQKERYQAAMSYIDELTSQWSSAQSTITILYL
jgi:hypothetical protein